MSDTGTEGKQRKNEQTEEPLAVVDADSLQTWTEVLSGVVDEARIEINDNGIRAAMTDPANVAHIDACLSEPEASVQSQEETVVGANIASLHDHLIPLNGSTLDVCVDDSEGLKLQMETDLESVEIDLISADVMRDSSLPGLDYSERFSLPGRAFSAAVELFDAVDKHSGVWFTVDGDSETLELRPHKAADQVTVTFDLSGKAKGPLSDVETLYSTDYLAQFFGSVDATGYTIDVQMDEDHPMKLSFSPMEGLDVLYVQAPRIQA